MTLSKFLLSLNICDFMRGKYKLDQRFDDLRDIF